MLVQHRLGQDGTAWFFDTSSTMKSHWELSRANFGRKRRMAGVHDLFVENEVLIEDGERVIPELGDRDGGSFASGWLL